MIKDNIVEKVEVNEGNFDPMTCSIDKLQSVCFALHDTPKGWFYEGCLHARIITRAATNGTIQ